eukprot:652020-Alexandrium_andersonii.AAC.1
MSDALNFKAELKGEKYKHKAEKEKLKAKQHGTKGERCCGEKAMNPLLEVEAESNLAGTESGD